MKVIIGICGGIAAYKTCEVISQLFQKGVQVRVVLTKSARDFVTPLSVSTLSRHSAYLDEDLWRYDQSKPLHIELGEWADLIVVAPVTANTIGKLAHGLADNLLTNIILASDCPILLAPAMNTEMWQQMAVARNYRILREDPRYHRVGPGEGLLACDRTGAGRMAQPKEILSHIESLLYTNGKKDLEGKKVLISGGGTREYLDPVRFIGNPATGKMGAALAAAAVHRGAQVTLVHAPMDVDLLVDNTKLTTIPIVSAQQMQEAMITHQPQADWIVMNAAVADVKPAMYSSGKIAKQNLPESLELVKVPDILKKLGEIKQPQQRLVGFAAQTGDIITPAKAKLKAKQLDVIVANPVDVPLVGFGGDRNEGVLIDRWGRVEKIPICSKLELAHRLYDFLSLWNG